MPLGTCPVEGSKLFYSQKTPQRKQREQASWGTQVPTSRGGGGGARSHGVMLEIHFEKRTGSVRQPDARFEGSWVRNVWISEPAKTRSPEMDLNPTLLRSKQVTGQREPSHRRSQWNIDETRPIPSNSKKNRRVPPTISTERGLRLAKMTPALTRQLGGRVAP